MVVAIGGCGGKLVRARVSRPGIDALTLLAALSSCGGSGNQATPPLPSLFFATTTMAPNGDAYDGPAVVERSVAGELVLAFAADTANGGVLPRHATIDGVGPTVFPVGAQVWLKKTPVVEPLQPSITTQFATMSLAVLTEKEGTLLLGVEKGPDAASMAAMALVPLQVKGTTRHPQSNPCASVALETTTFDVSADSPLAISDGDTRVARIGGIDYDLGLAARRLDIDVSTAKCDVSPGIVFELSVRAHDLGPLIATLGHGETPACALGNDKLEGVWIMLSGLAPGDSVDAPVAYTKRGAREGSDCFDFSVQLFSPEPGLPLPSVEVCVPPGSLAEPSKGQELWATILANGISALRRANRGDLIAASIVTSGGNVTSAQISDALGMPVDMHPGCLYAEVDSADVLYQHQLLEVAFGAPTPVVVGSQQHGVVSTGATDYDVWVQDGGWITIVAR